MRKICLLLLFVSLACNSQWVQVSNGMGGGGLFAFTVNGNNVYAGFSGNNGVYLSTNNGTSWTQTLINVSVYSLAVNGNYIFCRNRW